MIEPTVEALADLIEDLYGRSGVDYAIDACREFMEPEQIDLLDWALDRVVR